jgi:UDP-3-O-[3-hydroxymyristoyl] glucosamine N-acyltransferase
LQEYDKYTQAQLSGVEEPAFLGDGSSVGENCYRAAFSYVGKNVTIGNHVKIHAHASIGDGSTIGDHTVIHAGAKLYPKTVVGAHCVIHSGAVSGSDGFGNARQEDGSYRPIPQVGNVVIEDHVSIGANTTIDCATLDSTIIREGAKLDNLIQIAHNVEVGAHTAIAAQTGVSGSAKIGKHCIIAGQVGIVGHLSIADKVIVGAQAGVGKSIKKEGTILLGSPAFEIGPYKRSYALFRNLPKIADRVNELEKKVLNLPASKE